MGKFEEECASKGLVARDVKNAIIVNLWMFAWAGSNLRILANVNTQWRSS